MDRRQRMIVQAGLALVAGLLAWRLGAEWQQADLRYSALASPAGQSAAGLPVAARAEPLVVDEIAAKNLFSADRNNQLAAPESSQTGPPPPVPIVLGTLKLGESYEALMSEGDSARRGARRVKQGEQIGSYRVTEIRAESVVIEYEGQTTTLDIYQSARGVMQQRARTATLAGPAAPVVVGTGGGQPASRPSTPPAQTQGAAQQRRPPGVRVFVERNRRRLERDTPFGVQTWYEPLEQGAGNGE